MNFLAFEGTNFDIKPNGDGTFRAIIDLPGSGVRTPPLKITIPRCAISFEPYFDRDKAERPYVVEINCNDASDTLALCTCCGGKEFDQRKVCQSTYGKRFAQK